MKKHQIDYYLNLINRKPGNSTELVWTVTKEEKVESEKLLAKRGIRSEDTLIGINPGAVFGPAKRWFPEKFARVADKLIKKHCAKILLFGSHREKDVTKKIRNLMANNPVDLAGETNLRELGAIISLCKLMITNDSGAMHIAVAVKTPVLAIFGSTDPSKTGPLGKHDSVIYKNLRCSPCFSKKCPHGDYKCLREIQTEEVFLSAEAKLKNAG